MTFNRLGVLNTLSTSSIFTLQMGWEGRKPILSQGRSVNAASTGFIPIA